MELEKKYHHSNTSHVIVYRMMRAQREKVELHSNTSHVIVYRYFNRMWNYRFLIQIHLMLLFIGISFLYNHSIFIQIHLMLLFIPNPKYKEPEPIIFKYISCYCLSSSLNLLYAAHVLIQIHLMLLFIESRL